MQRILDRPLRACVLAALLAVPALAVAQAPKSTGASFTGTVDDNWKLNMDGAGFGAAIKLTTLPGVWAVAAAGSAWIGNAASASSYPHAADYVYTTSFDLTGYDPTATSFSYRCALDNFLKTMKLNGSSIGGVCGVFGFGAVTSVSSGFVSGVNTIEINLGGDGTTDGLLYEIKDFHTEASTVPEPASMALVATGLLGLGIVTRRRRK